MNLSETTKYHKATQRKTLNETLKNSKIFQRNNFLKNTELIRKIIIKFAITFLNIKDGTSIIRKKY